MTYPDDTVPTTVQTRDGPSGIGGWLTLPILGLISTLMLTSYNLFSAFTKWEGIKAIIAGDNDTATALRLPMAASLLSGVAVIGLAALCLYRVSIRSPTVPRLMTVFYIGLVTVSVIELLSAYRLAALIERPMDPDNVKDLARTVIVAAIWIPYFHRSRRVANTFRTREALVDSKIGEIF